MLVRVGSLVVASLVVVLAASSTASGGTGLGDQFGAVELAAQVRGELADGYVDSNPCEATPPFTKFTYRPTGEVKSGAVTYTYDATSDLTPESQSAQWFVSGGEYSDFYGAIDAATFSTVTITERRYLVGCTDPEGDPGEFDPATVGPVWVPVVTEESLIPDVMAKLVAVIPAPDVFFPVADPTYGWLYVRTPMEVRVRNLAPVTRDVTAANAISSATATATAEPVEVIFEPGEPDGPATVCSVESVEMGWDRNDPDGSGCVYSYSNSSAIVPPEHKFQARTRVVWHVTGSGGLDMMLETIAHDYVAVAEVQAVVVAP